MRSFYSLAVLALPMLAPVLCEDEASPTKSTSPNPFYANANEAFRDLLNALPEESLHVALNSLAHFQNGVFESDRHGVERVHKENPPLATKLIVAAVQDLKKRQQLPATVNGTGPGTPTPSPEPPASSAPPPPPEDSSAPPPPPPQSSGPPPAVIPVPISTTDENGQATIITSDFLSEATAVIPVPVTLTDSAGQTIVTEQSKPAIIFTATDSAGSAFVTTSAVEFAPTPGQVFTATNAQGSTFLTTYTPGGGRVSSILLITTTGADGQPLTLTSYTYVDPAEATQTGDQAPPTGTTRPGLQSNAAVAENRRGVEAAVVGGVVGWALALFI